MTWHVRSGGTWRDITDPQVRVGGTWRPVTEAWVRVSGTWRKYYQRIASVILNNAGYSRSANTASLTISSDGNVYATNGGASSLQYAWLLSGLASSVEVRCTVTAGTFSSGTTGAWESLGTSRVWTRTWPGGMSPVQATGTFEIRDASSGTVLTSASISLIATP